MVGEGGSGGGGAAGSTATRTYILQLVEVRLYYQLTREMTVLEMFRRPTRLWGWDGHLGDMRRRGHGLQEVGGPSVWRAW